MQIDDLVQHVRLELPGVMDLIVVRAIAMTAGDFCTRTLVWDEIQDPVMLIDGVNQYDLEAPVDARCLTIGNVWAAAHELRPAPMSEVARLLPNWQTAQSSVPTLYNAARDWNEITVFPIPMNANRALLTFRAQYAPTANAQTLPDFLASRYLDALLAGAKARLMSQANVPWSNPQLALYHQGAYETAVGAATIHQLRARVPSELRVQPRRFG